MFEEPHDAELESLGELAEEFLTHRRQGDPTSVESLAAAHPELSGEIRALFPVLMLLEDNRPEPAVAPRGDVLEGSREEAPLPRRLGEYTLLRELGRGGMGVVFEAWHEALGRRVAIKLLAAPSDPQGRAHRRFLREARIVARLRHPHIVPVHVVGEHDGVLFYVMDLIPGTSLDRPEFRDVAGDTGGSRARWVASLGIQAAEALAYAHHQDILHRDVKPSNFLVDGDGKLWLADFGLAKLLGDPSLTPSGEWPGTLRYLAPECLRGESSVLSDIYSLGLTLYELVVGVPAFEETDRDRLLRQIAAAALVPPRRLDPTIPRELESIILKAAEGDPAARYQSADGLAEDLRRFLDGRPVRARRDAGVRLFLTRLRRHRGLGFLAATTVFLAIATLLLAWNSVISPAPTTGGSAAPAARTGPPSAAAAEATPPPADRRPAGPPRGLGLRHSPAGPGPGRGFRGMHQGMSGQ